MNKKGLTITMVFKAQSLNYGEGIGNISELKKLTRGDGSVYTFASRQALRYDIARLGNKLYNWNLEVVDKSQGTVQFKNNLTIEDSEEMDLFGYMRTSRKEDDKLGGSNIRSAAVRLSNAISLENYKADMDFLNNKGLADRINEFPNLANIEQHFSYYTYTVTIDLEKVGKDNEVELSNEEKTKRVIQLLEIIKILNREIRGREENLSPLFIVGGLYAINSPFFLGRVNIDGKNGKFSISTQELEDTMKLKVGEQEIGEDTSFGIVNGEFENEEQIKELFTSKVKNVQNFFENLENKVKEYYK